MEFDFCIVYHIDCFDRELIICWNADENMYQVPIKTSSGIAIRDEIACEALIYSILDVRYLKWNSPENYPDEYEVICNSCCEEYMLAGLDKIGLKYTPIYIGSKKETKSYVQSDISE